MNGAFESAGEKLWHACQGNGDEALHVTGAAAEEFAAFIVDLEGIGVPWLAIHRHDVRMP